MTKLSAHQPLSSPSTMWSLLFIALVAAAVTACPVNLSSAKKAVCQVKPNPGSSQPVSGRVTFSQESDGRPVTIVVALSGFNPVPDSAPEASRRHGFHVHQSGNISASCDNAGGHFNPEGVNHGDRTDAVRHAGDYGNIEQAANGTLRTTFTDNVSTLYGPNSILGRAIVVHANEDDLGRGGNAASLANGNAGPRLACCVILEV